MSADQSPPTPPASPGANPQAGGNVPSRLFFPDEPAVPPPPRPGGPPQWRPGPPTGAREPGPEPGAGQAPPEQESAGPESPGESLPGQAPLGQGAPGQPPPPGQAPLRGARPPGQRPFPGQSPFPGPPPPPGASPRPGGSPRQRKPRPTAPSRRELRQRALAASIFGLISLFALSAAGEVKHALYLVAFSFAVAVLAIVAGASAARRARREETARPRGSLAAVILGSAAIFLCAVSLVAIVFATQFSNYETCISNAPSSAAKQVCAQRFMQAVQNEVNGTNHGG